MVLAARPPWKREEVPLTLAHAKFVKAIAYAKVKTDKVDARERQIEAHWPGDLVRVDTFYVGTLKGVGKVYLQSVLDCFSRVAWGRLFTSKLPLTAVQTLNNDVLPYFEERGIRIRTVLSDNVQMFPTWPPPNRPNRLPENTLRSVSAPRSPEGHVGGATAGSGPGNILVSRRRIARLFPTCIGRAATYDVRH